jgi:hypothetical protein
MRTHRFGQQLRLPSTIGIKRGIIKLMLEDEVKQSEARAKAELDERRHRAAACVRRDPIKVVVPLAVTQLERVPTTPAA